MSLFLAFSPSSTVHLSLLLFCPLLVSLSLRLPLQCAEVIAPAEPQAVVALHWLLYLLIWPASPVYHVTLKLCMAEITQADFGNLLEEHFTTLAMIITTPGLGWIIFELMWKPDVLNCFRKFRKSSTLGDQCYDVFAFHPHRWNGNECLCCKIEAQKYILFGKVHPFFSLFFFFFIQEHNVSQYDPFQLLSHCEVI